jgi:hypothetical protein
MEDSLEGVTLTPRPKKHWLYTYKKKWNKNFFFATKEYSLFIIKKKRITRRSYERTLVAQITNHEGSDERRIQLIRTWKKEKRKSDCPQNS